MASARVWNRAALALSALCRFTRCRTNHDGSVRQWQRLLTARTRSRGQTDRNREVRDKTSCRFASPRIKMHFRGQVVFHMDHRQNAAILHTTELWRELLIAWERVSP